MLGVVSAGKATRAACELACVSGIGLGTTLKDGICLSESKTLRSKRVIFRDFLL